MLQLTFQSVFCPFSPPLNPHPLNTDQNQNPLELCPVSEALGGTDGLRSRTRRHRETDASKFPPRPQPGVSFPLDCRRRQGRCLAAPTNRVQGSFPRAAIRPMAELGVERSSDEPRWLRPCTTRSSC
ncbi:unnamed protein product [Pipistrellus nathusii]|uniref:Uncharacterized protein n=1 Tax=Pipistrellus nathusii TaxID=59473 RepID=A0ABP0AE86_PIPNA